MIYQLLDGTDNRIKKVILGTDNLKFYADRLEENKIDTLLIDNSLAIQGSPASEDILALKNKGIKYYPAGRTGIPSMVTAEDGLAAPGIILASDDKNLLELAVLGAYVIYLSKEDMLSLMNSGSTDLQLHDVKNIVLSGKLSQWVSGIDVALHIINYFGLPKNIILEIQGEGLSSLELNERFALARTLVDFGYEKLLFQVDDKVLAFLQDRSKAEAKFYFPDTEAHKESILNIELEKIHPMIAWKDNEKIKIGPITDKDGLKIEQIFIGGDNGGRYSDIEAGLKLIRYRPLNDSIRAAIIPGSQLVYSDMLDMGVSGIFTELGFEILPSSILALLTRQADIAKARLGTSVSLLHSGCMIANALSCFSAAISGKIIHPMELESILKEEEKNEHREKK